MLAHQIFRRSDFSFLLGLFFFDVAANADGTIGPLANADPAMAAILSRLRFPRST